MKSLSFFAAAVIVAILGIKPTATAGWREELREPPREMTQVPFWFWNDELSDRETARQMADFRAKGVYGFVIHARMGLPGEIRYMGPRWLAHVRFAVEEAARTGMRVCLYDEGMYPSGSAHGEVVRSNPAFAAQGLAAQSKEVSGPAEIDAAAAPEGRHVATVAVPIAADGRTLGLDRAIVLAPDRGKVALGPGRWRVMRFAAVPSGGHIRGVHPGEEGGQPDVGPHNVWWPHYRLLADYTSRLSWLMTDSQQVCQVAVLSVGNRLPWRAAKWLFQNQVDFNYLEDWRLLEQARPTKGTIRVGPMEYRLLVVDEDEPLPPALAAKVRELASAGLLARNCSRNPSADLVADLSRDVAIQPACADLRAAHVVKQGVSFYLLVNEGEQPIDTRVSVPVVGRTEWFDPWLNTFRLAPAKREKERIFVPLRLARRESLVLCVDPATPLQAGPAEPAAAQQVVPIAGPWRIVDRQGKPRGEGLGPWEQLPGLERFVGSLCYQARLPAAKEPGRRYVLELPAVGDWAVLKVNGRDLGPRFWTPMTWDITEALRPGENEASIEVTDSLANRFDRKNARPSGLLAPPRLAGHRRRSGQED